MPCTCSPSTQTFQKFPTSGRLAENLNLPFEDIVAMISDDEPGEAYCYIMTSIANANGGMEQRGSGPNIQGDYITLCTCMRQMRTYRAPINWEGVWVIGVSGAAANVDNAVFYMMKVMKAYRTHYDLWNSDILSSQTKKAKAAHLHRLGDIFEPLNNDAPFDPASYKKPVHNHSHAPVEWYKDIQYDGAQTGKKPALLVGDPAHSFIWEFPQVFRRPEKNWRTRHIELTEFDDHFEGRLR